jgi:CHRD domain
MIEYLKRHQKGLLSVFLAIVTCCFAVVSAKPSLSMRPSDADMQSVVNEVRSRNYPQQAKSVLMAQQGTLVGQSGELKTFAAVLSGDLVYPNPVDAMSTGAVGAALSGNRLIVRGGFRTLSGPLRDYAVDPASPANPKVNSAVHIHRGSATQNGPFQYALQVQLNSDGLGGNVEGEYMLTDEQLQALNSGMLYVDLHTKRFRAGELRGVLKAQDMKS